MDLLLTMDWICASVLVQRRAWFDVRMRLEQQDVSIALGANVIVFITASVLIWASVVSRPTVAVVNENVFLTDFDAIDFDLIDVNTMIVRGDSCAEIQGLLKLANPFLQVLRPIVLVYLARDFDANRF
jgi:hypothetical protein